MADPVRILTPDEIEAMIHAMAQGDHEPSKRWALGKIGAASQGITIPPPRTEEEIQVRIVRLLKGVGRTSSYRCLRIAFPTEGGKSEVHIDASITEAAKEEARPINPPTNLNSLFKAFPECGRDKWGYPPNWSEVEGKSQMKKRAWIMNLAHQLNNARKAHEQGVRVEEVK